MKYTAYAYLAVLILLIGFTQAAWPRPQLRHQTFKPLGYDLLQTDAQTETKTETETETTLTTAVSSETDCDPDCLYKYPYIEGDCSDQSGQPAQPQAPSQPEQNYPGEESQAYPQFNEPQPSENQGETIVPPQNEQNGSPSEEFPAFPSQNGGEVTVTSPFPVPEEDDSSDETSSVYRYPFDNAGAGCEIISENVEEVVSGAESDIVEVTWEEVPTTQPEDIPQDSEDEQVSSGVLPIDSQDLPQSDQEEQASVDVEQESNAEQPTQIEVEDLQGQYIIQNEEETVQIQQVCGEQVSESEVNAPQGEEVPFEGQGVVNYGEVVYTPPQSQVPAQPESRPEQPVYNPSYGASDTPTCSCVCGYGSNTFSYSFKL